MEPVRRCFLLLAVLASATAALGAAGAEEPQPDPFAEDLLKYRSYFDYGGFQPDLGSALPEGYLQKWTPRVSVSGTYTDNAEQTADGSSAFWANAALGLGWLRRSPRLEGTLDYRYSTPFYQTGDPEGRDTATHEAAGQKNIFPRGRQRLNTPGDNSCGRGQHQLHGVFHRFLGVPQQDILRAPADIHGQKPVI